MTQNFIPRVFSGIQPSGGLTLGNYLGAIKRFVDMQEDGHFETVYCMVDLHAITVWQNPENLRRNTRELCAGFMLLALILRNPFCLIKAKYQSMRSLLGYLIVWLEWAGCRE